MARDAVDDLRELDRRDAELRAQADRLRAVDAEVGALRARAEQIAAFFTAYPDADTRLRSAVHAADADLERRRSELARAEEALERASGDDARIEAAHVRDRAADHVAVATAALDRARAAHDELEAAATAFPGELDDVAADARRLAAELPEVPQPGVSPHELVEWASRAHASIFVSTGAIDTQRDRIAREANELGTMLLGEPTYGSTVAQVTARVLAAHR